MAKWVLIFSVSILIGFTNAGYACELRTEIDPGDGIVGTRIFVVIFEGKEIYRTIYRSEVETFLTTDPRCVSRR